MKQNRQPILVPSTKFGKKGCSKLLQTHLSFRRQEQDVDSTSVLASSVGVETDANKDEQESNNKQQRLDCTSGSCSYWPASPDAYQLFRPRDSINTSSGSSNNSTDTITISSPQEAVERCITRLQAVYAGEDSWRCEARVEIPTIFAKGLTLRVLAEPMFLCMAYQLALQNMNKWTWQDCCREACSQLNDLGMQHATFNRTIAEWNILYRKLEGFPHPNAYVQCWKRPLPLLLEIFPDAEDQIFAFVVKNLATLTIEGVIDLILSTVIPPLALHWKNDTRNDRKEQDEAAAAVSERTLAPENQEGINASFLKAHPLKSMSFSTAWRSWMHLLGTASPLP
jgi:hypothetical protein